MKKEEIVPSQMCTLEMVFAPEKDNDSTLRDGRRVALCGVMDSATADRLIAAYHDSDREGIIEALVLNKPYPHASFDEIAVMDLLHNSRFVAAPLISAGGWCGDFGEIAIVDDTRKITWVTNSLGEEDDDGYPILNLHLWEMEKVTHPIIHLPGGV